MNLIQDAIERKPVRFCLDFIKLSMKALMFDPRELAGQFLGRIRHQVITWRLNMDSYGHNNNEIVQHIPWELFYAGTAIALCVK
jgi:hypothetical protein